MGPDSRWLRPPSTLTMRTLGTLLSILCAVALIMYIAPYVVDTCSTFIADLSVYLSWIDQGRASGGDMAMAKRGFQP